MKNYYAILMAGGIGERFKPLSTPEFPKQFHDLLGKGKSLLKLTYDRFHGFVPDENIFVATNDRYKSIIQSQLENLSEDQLLLETAKRNTAPCILFSALKIFQKDPDGIMIICPTDHRIENNTEFINNLKVAASFCVENDALVTLGIAPNEARTEYGYINFQDSNQPIKKVNRFTEKPTKERADEFLKSGNYLWNAGIFIWSVRSVLKAFNRYQAEMVTLFSGVNFWNQREAQDFLKNIYPKSKNISVDFGIMENANNIYVLAATFDWSDIGSWKSLYEILPKDQRGMATVGNFEIMLNKNGELIIFNKGREVLRID